MPDCEHREFDELARGGTTWGWRCRHCGKQRLLGYTQWYDPGALERISGVELATPEHPTAELERLRNQVAELKGRVAGAESAVHRARSERADAERRAEEGWAQFEQYSLRLAAVLGVLEGVRPPLISRPGDPNLLEFIRSCPTFAAAWALRDARDELEQLLMDAWLQWSYAPSTEHPDARCDGGLSTLEAIGELLERRHRLERVAERPEMDWYRVPR